MNKLKKRWNITSNFQMAVIFLVFAITGSTSAWLSKPVLEIIGINKGEISPWIYYPLYIILIFPIYQVLLLFFGWLFGQFTFFWWFEKKMLRGIGLSFLLPAEEKED